MTFTRTTLMERARRKLLGMRVAPLTPDQVRRNLLYGPGTEQQWPQGATEINPVARALVAETGRVTRVNETGGN